MNVKQKKIKTFTDLSAWRSGHDLVLEIYRTTALFPRHEIFSLTDQMRRASVSITSNIAEGFGRSTYRQKLHFYFIAQGSLLELKNQLLIAKDLKYINKQDFNLLVEKVNCFHKLLQGLLTKTKFIIHNS